MLGISVLGPLEVRVDQTPVPLVRSLKTRALLGFLTINTTAQNRDDLCDMFFRRTSDPRAALRWSLSRLRPLLNTGAHERLVADRRRVRFEPDDTRVDLRDVEEAARDQHATPETLARAWKQTQQVLMEDGDVRSLPEYGAWLADQRCAMADLRLALAGRLAQSNDLPPSERLVWAKRAQNTPMVPTPPTPPRQDIRFLRTADGTSLAWAESGSSDGPVIVKAANWLSHLELDGQAPIWQPLYQGLEADHRMIRYDERGCGMSDWDVPEISFESFVTDLEQVVEASGVKQFALLGISQGAAVSIEYAARHPERVSKLILFGGYPAGWRHTASPQEIREREAVMVLTQSGWGRTDPCYRRLFSQTFMPQATLEELDWFDDYQRQTTSPENAVRFLEAFSQLDVRERLADVRVPTLVLHSRHDRRIPAATGRALAVGIPDARFKTLNSPGHLLLGREPAAREFVAEIRGFLGQTNGASV